MATIGDAGAGNTTSTLGQNINPQFCDSWTQLCAGVARELLPSAHDDAFARDPFASAMVIVPSAGHQRALTQYLAQNQATAAGGISAGVEFITLFGLRRRLYHELLGIDPVTDPWQLSPLTLSILDVLDASQDEPWFAPIAHHLIGDEARPGRRLTTARQIARLFSGYAADAPQLLEAWNQGQSVGFDGEALSPGALWQPEVWRLVRASIPSGDPLSRHQDFCAALREGQARLPQRLLATLVMSPRQQDQEFVSALSAGAGCHVLQLAYPAPPAAGSVLRRRYGSLRPSAPTSVLEPASPHTLLEAVQADLRFDRSPAGPYQSDSTFEIHASHGPDRQVEVLRDLLTGLFQDDPTLEPRDVLVLCTDLRAYAPLIAASFGPLAPRDAAISHPGHQLRAQLAAASLDSANPVLLMLRELLALARSRGQAEELLNFLALEPVSRKFDFRPEDFDRMARLLSAANTTWGIDTNQRSIYGLSEQSLGTWWNSIERMLAGAMMSSTPPTPLGTRVLPLPDVESSDLRLVGIMAEAVARIRKALFTFRKPGTIAEWTVRLKDAMQELADTAPLDSWQLSHAEGQLNDLAAAAVGRNALLSVDDLLDWFDDLTEPAKGRPNFFNGTLLFAQLGDVQAIEHRVVAVLGLDDSNFPTQLRINGDDLIPLTAHGRTRRLESRQFLVDAILAAQDRFFVVVQGSNEKTNLPLPAPVAILDLLAATGCADPSKAWEDSERSASSIVHRHALQAVSWPNFQHEPDRPSFSFDRQAFQGTLTLTERSGHPQRPTPWRYTFPGVTASELSGLTLAKFLKNPADQLLRTVAGLSVKVWSDEALTTLPLAPDHMAKYHMRDRMLHDMLSGASAADAIRAEGLRASVLMNAEGSQILNDECAKVTAIASSVRHFQQGEPLDDDLSIEIAPGQYHDGVLLTHRVRTWSGQAISYRAGRVSISMVLDAWIDLLLWAAARPNPGTAILIGNGASWKMQAPSPHDAPLLLTRLVDLYFEGMTRIIPLPPRTASVAAGIFNNFSKRRVDHLEQAAAEWHDDFQRSGECFDATWQHFYPEPDDFPLDGEFKALVADIYGPITAAILTKDLRVTR